MSSFHGLQNRELPCKENKCSFSQPTVEYLEPKLTSKGITKEMKANVAQHVQNPKGHTQLAEIFLKR